MPIKLESAPFFRFFPSTHRPGGQHGRVVVDVCDRDNSGGGVGEAKVQVSLHICGLHDDGVLGDFLWKVQTHSGQLFIHLFIRSSAGTAAKLTPERTEKSPSDFSSSALPRSSFKTSSQDQVWDRLKAAAALLPLGS